MREALLFSVILFLLGACQNIDHDKINEDFKLPSETIIANNDVVYNQIYASFCKCDIKIQNQYENSQKLKEGVSYTVKNINDEKIIKFQSICSEIIGAQNAKLKNKIDSILNFEFDEKLPEIAKNKIYICENIILHYLYSLVAYPDIYTGFRKLIIIPENKVVSEGEKFKVRFLVAAIDTISEFYLEPENDKSVKFSNGELVYEIEHKDVGLKTLKGKVISNNITGTTKTFPFEIEYAVIEKQ